MGVTEERELAARLLADLPRRWQHTCGVAGRAGQALAAVPSEDAGAFLAAAWLHDVGYSPQVAKTGLHALDGACYLTRHGADDVVCRLVAYHSGAEFEAEERGLASGLGEFGRPPEALLDALTFADMTTGPDGQQVEIDQRLSEILHRYDDGNPVHRAVERAAPRLRQAVRRTEARLALLHQPM